MWGRTSERGDLGDGAGERAAKPSGDFASGRRAYYRVEGILPIRLTPLAPEEVDAALFDLSMPDPLCAPVGEGEEDTPLMARLRRIEEKLDLLLGVAPIDVPRQLSGRDRRPLVFSGSGLAVEIDGTYASGDAYRVEILLPPPYARTLRAVGYAARDGRPEVGPDTRQPLPLALTHMDDEDRDALVAYSYDLQRFALRARTEGAGRRAGETKRLTVVRGPHGPAEIPGGPFA
ncbi:MAG: hypothetical protein NXI30_03835 [bacterium]|nr:hypothetical protein [bacterium]